VKLRRRIADAVRNPARIASLGRRIAEIALRGELPAVLGRLYPRAFSPARYRTWIAARARALAALEAASTPSVVRLLVLVDPDDDADTAPLARSLLSRLRDGDALCVRRADGGWRGASATAAQSPTTATSLDDALDRMRGDAPVWILWVSAPLELEPHAVPTFARIASQFPRATLIYADDDCPDHAHRRLPRFKPAWDTEQILEHNYVGPVLALHGSLAARIGREGLRGTYGVWRLLIEAAASQPPDAVVHVPHVLAHLRGNDSTAARIESAAPGTLEVAVAAAAQRGTQANVAETAGVPRFRYGALPSPEHASIVIPIRDRPDLLRRCVASICALTRAPDYELVIVDNGSTDPEVGRYCRELATAAAIRIVPAPGAFNFAHLCNVGAAAATGRVLALLNNDTQVVDPGWLDELCSLAIRPGTGAVGPLLTYEDGTVQSAGVLLGVNRVATNALAGLAIADATAREWCSSRRRVTAVVGACLAVERDKYLAVAGMDEGLAVSLNEVDLCLRLEARGLANVFTPFVRVIHIEGATRGYDVLPAERRLLREEERRFLRRWGEIAARCDPARSPNLRRDGNTLALDFAAAPARPRAGWREP